jgi:hypothetical protein
MPAGYERKEMAITLYWQHRMGVAFVEDVGDRVQFPSFWHNFESEVLTVDAISDEKNLAASAATN